MKKRLLDPRIEDRFLWKEHYGPETWVLMVTEGPVHYFGTVTVEIAEWDFDFVGTTSTVVTLVDTSLSGRPG